jgi:WhiB family redox-sensing transcriptional regulator
MSSWREHAACRGIDPNVFYPDTFTGASDEGRTVCQRCPVTAECLAAGMNEDLGTWGDMLAVDRRRLRKHG